MALRGKKILLGVTGGIAAYKCAYLVRELIRQEAEVRVVMTHAATEFIQPLTFSALTRHPVSIDLWNKDQSTDSAIGTRHVHLATWCDAMVIAPASANTMAKLSAGMADNLLTVLALACRRPLILAPTMDADMFLNEATQHNLAVLRERGCFIIPPDDGEHASGLTGPGRLPEVESIVDHLDRIFAGTAFDLKKVRVLVTAGPTHEPIDPVRFIGNRSSGKMGFAIARAAALRGAEVTLVSGPVSLETPRHVKRVNVETAAEMKAAVASAARKADVVIMAAAVSDYAPARSAAHKIKKTARAEAMDLHLVATDDILADLGSRRRKGTVLVGFALETEKGIEHATSKLRSKNLDLVVLNTVSPANPAFGSDMNTVTFIDRTGTVRDLPTMPKIAVADRLLDRVATLL